MVTAKQFGMVSKAGGPIGLAGVMAVSIAVMLALALPKGSVIFIIEFPYPMPVGIEAVAIIRASPKAPTALTAGGNNILAIVVPYCLCSWVGSCFRKKNKNLICFYLAFIFHPTTVWSWGESNPRPDRFLK